MDNQRVFVWAALALVLWLNYHRVAARLRAGSRRTAAAAATSRNDGAAPPSDTLPELPSELRRRSRTIAAAARRLHRQPASRRRRSEPASFASPPTCCRWTSARAAASWFAPICSKYPMVKNQPDVPVRLFNPTPSGSIVARSGLRAADKRAEPTHLAMFQSAANEYQLKPGETKLDVPLTWTDGQGSTVTKTYTFHPGSYRIDLTYDVDESVRQRLEGCLVRAAGASLRARRTLVFQRRDVRLSRPGDLRRQGLSQAGRRRRRGSRLQGHDYRRLDGGAAASLRRGRRAAAGCSVRLSAQPRYASNDFTLSYRGPLDDRAGRRHADVQGNLVRRSEAAGAAAGDRAEARAASPTTASSRSSRSRCSGCSRRCTASSATGAGRSSSSRS